MTELHHHGDRRVGAPQLSHVRAGWKKRAVLDVKAAAKEIHAAFPGRVKDCEFMRRLRASDLAGLELLEALTAFPGFSLRQTGFDALAASPDMWTDPALTQVQTFWVGQFTAAPFDEHGRRIEGLIRRRGAELVPAVWPALIAWFAAGHRAPKAFFTERAVLPLVPDTDEIAALLTDLPHGHAIWLAGKPFRGGRAA